MSSCEFGDLIFEVPRSWPLRMRASRSPMGSLIAILCLLPARLGHARDLAEIRKNAQRDTRHLHLAVIALRTAAHLATMVAAGLGRIARQLRELEPRGFFVFCLFFFFFVVGFFFC